MPCNGDENQTCDENAKCQNGGTCEPHRGICLCPKGYTGKFCENDIDECEDKVIFVYLSSNFFFFNLLICLKIK